MLYFPSSSDGQFPLQMSIFACMCSFKMTPWNLGGKVLTVGLNCAERSSCSNTRSDATFWDIQNGFNQCTEYFRCSSFCKLRQYQITSWTFLLHKLCSDSPSRLYNGCILAQDASECKYIAVASWVASFFLLFPLSFPFLLSRPHSLLTCTYLCPCVLCPGIKRSTVWTQPMPSKSLAASCLHGMDCVCNGICTQDWLKILRAPKHIRSTIHFGFFIDWMWT